MSQSIGQPTFQPIMNQALSQTINTSTDGQINEPINESTVPAQIASRCSQSKRLGSVNSTRHCRIIYFFEVNISLPGELDFGSCTGGKQDASWARMLRQQSANQPLWLDSQAIHAKYSSIVNFGATVSYVVPHYYK